MFASLLNMCGGIVRAHAIENSVYFFVIICNLDDHGMSWSTISAYLLTCSNISGTIDASGSGSTSFANNEFFRRFPFRELTTRLAIVGCVGAIPLESMNTNGYPMKLWTIKKCANLQTYQFVNSTIAKFANAETCKIADLRSCQCVTFQNCQCAKLRVCKPVRFIKAQIYLISFWTWLDMQCNLFDLKCIDCKLNVFYKR